MLSVIFSPQCNKACICWHPFATFSASQIIHGCCSEEIIHDFSLANETFTEKYSKHVLLINNHHHNYRQHIPLCILFGWTPCMRTAKLAGLSSPRRWMLQKENTTSLVYKTNEKTSKSPLFQTEVISQLVELAWSIYTESYPSGHPVKTA